MRSEFSLQNSYKKSLATVAPADNPSTEKAETWTAFPRMTSEDVSSLHTRSHACAYTHVCVHTQMCTRTRPHEKLKYTDGWNSPAGSFYSKAWKSRLSSSGAGGDGLWVGGGGLGESCSFAHSRTIYFLVTRRNVRSTRRWALNGYLKTAQDNLTSEQQRSKVLGNHRNFSQPTSLVEPVTQGQLLFSGNHTEAITRCSPSTSHLQNHTPKRNFLSYNFLGLWHCVPGNQ